MTTVKITATDNGPYLIEGQRESSTPTENAPFSSIVSLPLLQRFACSAVCSDVRSLASQLGSTPTSVRGSEARRILRARS